MYSEAPRFRRAHTTNDGFRTRIDTPLYTSANGADAPPIRRRSVFSTAFSLLGALHEMQRDRAPAEQVDNAPTSSSRRQTSQRSVQDDRRPGNVPRERRPDIRLPRRSTSNDYEDAAHRSDSNRRAPDRNQDNEESEAREARRPDELRARLRRLARVVRHEEEDIELYSEWLSHYAHRSSTSQRAIQESVEKLQKHKRRLEIAQEELQRAREEGAEEVDGHRDERPSSHRRRSSQKEAEEVDSHRDRRPSSHRRRSNQEPTRTSTSQATSPGVENLFNVFFGPAAGFVSIGSNRDTFHAQSVLFDNLFANVAFHAQSTFESTQGARTFPPAFAQASFTTSSNSNSSRPGARSASTFPQPRAAPARPQNLLTSSEAKKLFDTYNDRWKNISASDPSIPYPGRRLDSNALTATDTIWAPLVNTPVSSWSKEDIVRANTKTFFLAVVGFSPRYSDHLCKIEVDFDHSRSTSAQLQLLIDMMKKEKLRWHSDRLARRNSGLPGLNESLQQDEIARGVFHAVCELSDLVVKKKQDTET